MAGKNLHIGVFLPSPTPTQLLDTACIDVLAVMSQQYLKELPMIPSHLVSLAPDMTISYIGSSSQGAGTLAPLTAGMTIRLTHHHSDPEVAPGKLDMVLVPGPDPGATYDPDALDWLRRQAGMNGRGEGHKTTTKRTAKTTDILSICTGIYVCGAAGLLGGRRACGPRGLQRELAAMYPTCDLVGHELRWVRDGNLWSSGGVTNGNDLVAAYCRESGRLSGPVVEVGLKLADVGDRGQKYGGSEGVYFLGLGWQVVKAWFMSFGGGRGKGKGKDE